jgi:pyrroline-5-carboxylate reductase
MKQKNLSIGFIGAGNMAGAIIEGMLASKIVTARSLFISDNRRKQLLNLAKDLGVRSVLKNTDLISKTDVVIIAVKPQDIKTVLEEIGSCLRKNQIVISIAAGVSLKTLRKYLKKAHVVRVMPNLGCFLRESATAVSYEAGEQKRVKDITNMLFGSLGVVIDVSEKRMHVVTALSGSGPAYIAFISQILISAAHKSGLNKVKAEKLFNHTLLASSLFLDKGKLDTKELMQRVTSKGGTTEAALSVLKREKIDKSLDAALKAAIKRSKELSK